MIRKKLYKELGFTKSWTAEINMIVWDLCWPDSVSYIPYTIIWYYLQTHTSFFSLVRLLTTVLLNFILRFTEFQSLSLPIRDGNFHSVPLITFLYRNIYLFRLSSSICLELRCFEEFSTSSCLCLFLASFHSFHFPGVNLIFLGLFASSCRLVSTLLCVQYIYNSAQNGMRHCQVRLASLLSYSYSS